MSYEFALLQPHEFRGVSGFNFRFTYRFMVVEYHILSETTGWAMLPLICSPKFLYSTHQLHK